MSIFNTNALIQNFAKEHALLYLYVDETNPTLLNLYTEHVDAHNKAIMTDPFPNSGFDIFVPEQEDFENIGPRAKMVDFRIKSEMRVFDKDKNEWKTTAFYVYPRSSLSKTPLMLANHTGIIDSGYRGYLMGAFRYLGGEQNTEQGGLGYTVAKHARLLQICSPDLRPVLVKLVAENFYEITARGSGGFGSTGL